MIGFLGARVYEALYGRPFPEGVQVAENLHARGIIDAVVPVERLAEMAARTLSVLDARHTDQAPVPRPEASVPDPYAGLEPPASAWDSILLSRRTDRPGVKTLLKLGASDVLLLRGTGQGEHDPGMLLALARFGGTPCIVLGQDRHRKTLEEPLGPGGLRVARRGIRLAADLNLPLVSIIDTEGAALSKEAEEGGLAGEIARSLADLVMLPAPTLCVLLGQGTGGGALAILPADRVICAQHAWLSPLPPREPRRSCIARSSGPTRWRPRSGSARWICARTGSSTESFRSTPMPRRSPRRSADGWPRLSTRRSTSCGGLIPGLGWPRDWSATAGWAPSSPAVHAPAGPLARRF